MPEVWRYDGQLLTFHLLQGKNYQVCDRSSALPILRAEDIMRFLALYPGDGENSVIKQFRQWVRNSQT